MSLKVVHISDTHASHWELKMPSADLLAITGDLCGYGDTRELIDFNAWLGTIRHKYEQIYVVPGNHDKPFNDLYNAGLILSNATILFDQQISFREYNLYGSPWTIEFFNWHFMKRRGAEIKSVWSQIPDNTNILLTHQPPYGIFDSATDMNPPHKKIPVGCKDLLARTKELNNLKVHCFGHLHNDGGQTKIENGVLFSNGAMLDDDYILTRTPNIIDIP